MEVSITCRKSAASVSKNRRSAGAEAAFGVGIITVFAFLLIDKELAGLSGPALRGAGDRSQTAKRNAITKT
ncbi:hypothetical protein OFN23_30135, partial [Escherichia coli]|nr:hypothetical protein [Escherichia coli]